MKLKKLLKKVPKGTYISLYNINSVSKMNICGGRYGEDFDTTFEKFLDRKVSTITCSYRLNSFSTPCSPYCDIKLVIILKDEKKEEEN